MTAARRIFRCWMEEWEKAKVKKNDPVVEAKFLKKYGGLKWMDLDNTDAIMHAHPKRMEFRGGRKGDGWCLNAVDSNGDEEPWIIACALGQIKDYEQPAELNVLKLLPDEEVA